MAGMMMSCDEATFLISKVSDCNLTLREKINLKIHLLSCNLCLRYEKEIRAIDHYLKKKDLHACGLHSLDEDQKNRIQKNVLKEME